MSITLLITRGPASRASLRSAQLARALLDNGETVERVFFQGDGVQLCAASLDDSADPHGGARLWQSLISTHDLPATACSGSAQRRNVSGDGLAPGVEMAGLGQLAGAMNHCARLVSF